MTWTFIKLITMCMIYLYLPLTIDNLTYTIICKQLSSRGFTVSTIDRYKINSFLMLRMVDSAIYCAVSGGFCILLKNEGGHFAIKMIKV